MILYKYCSAESAICIIDEMRLKVAMPVECNDPFEFTPKSKNTLTCEEFLIKVQNEPEYFRPLYQQFVAEGFSKSFEDFLKKLPSEIKMRFPEVLRQYRRALVDYDLNSPKDASEYVGILCLSERNDSIPMWSHYSDSHKGVVIGIEANDESFQSSNIGKVGYFKHRVSIDPRAEAGSLKWSQQLYKIIFSKSSEWKYEAEHRMIFHQKSLISGKLEGDRSAFFVRLNKSAIRSVIFGCLTSQPNEASINQLLSLRWRFPHVKKFRAIRHPKNYSLKVVAAN
jgi:hypothetical protein